MRGRAARCRSACSAMRPRSCPELARRAAAGGPSPHMVTDQTSAHDLVYGYLPAGWSVERWQAAQARRRAASGTRRRGAAIDSAATSRRCSRSTRAASRRSTTATTSARSRFDEGVANAFDFPGFVPAYIRPLFCEGKGPFRWVALSGDPEDIAKTDRKVQELFPDNARSAALARHGRRAHRLPGVAGAHLLARSRRAPSRRAGVQRDGGERRAEGADRHRPRSPRHRIGREPEPRNRGDGATAPTPSPTGRC